MNEEKIKQIIEERGKKLAEEHAEWFVEVIRRVYVDAFIHGLEEVDKL